MKEQFAGWGMYDNYAVCKECSHKHLIAKAEQINPQPWLDWLTKHSGHSTAIVPKWLMEAFAAKIAFADNANIKTAYAASGTYTITLTSLASDATLLTGRESTGISNAVNLYLDELVGGTIMTGTTPTTATQIEVHAVGATDDTPTYPGAFAGSDAGRTSTQSTKNSSCKPLGILATLNTSNQAYWVGMIGIRQFFGDGLPVAHSLFVTHSTVAALNATATNHKLTHTPVYMTVV